jgi:ADP-heptose:LPS heptosyltransferase
MKFLVIRFSSIGDIVLTTPVIRCLHQQVPGAEIHVLTKQQFRVIFEANPYVHRVIELGYSKELMMHQLETEGYDAIIDLHHNLRTWQIKRALKGIPAYSFPKLNWQKWLLTACKINRLPAVHIVDRYLQTVQSFGVVNDGKGLDYFIPDKAQVRSTDLPFSHQMGYIGMVIGAAHATKQWPAKHWKELCSRISFPIILLGGKEDRANGAAIAAADPIKIYNACGKFSLHESADLVKQARLVVTHDTGLMHIAAAFRKPIISIWGNTIPAFGMTPYYGNASIAEKRSEVALSCRPCSKIGYNRCPRGHFNCMEKQEVGQIEQWVQELMTTK